jgi:hypothetical protein
VLLIVLVSLALCALAIAGIAKTAQLAVRRFHIDPMEVMLLLGLAEWPVAPSPERRDKPRPKASTPRARPGPRRRRRALSRRQAHSPFPSRG